MNNTVESFWRMVLLQRVGMIVTLCHEIGEFQTDWLVQMVERENVDCVGYFPVSLSDPVIRT